MRTSNLVRLFDERACHTADVDREEEEGSRRGVIRGTGNLLKTYEGQTCGSAETKQVTDKWMDGKPDR